jgi:hypothetical protein
MSDSTDVRTTLEEQSPLTPQSNNKVSSAIVKGLARTRKSVKILSCLGFFFCGLQVLGLGLVIFASDGLVGQILTQLVGAEYSVAYILIHLVSIWLCFYPSEKLHQYSRHIDALRGSYSEQDLLSAIKAQRSYWAFAACLTMITLALSILGFLILFILANS